MEYADHQGNDNQFNTFHDVFQPSQQQLQSLASKISTEVYSTVLLSCTEQLQVERSSAEMQNANCFTEQAIDCPLKIGSHSKDRLWSSWGDYDRRQFERVCADQGVGYPFGPSHLNVKSLFAAATGIDHELGLDGAYKHLGLTLEGTHHRGDDDAWNIAGIVCRLLKTMRNQ